MNCSFSANLEGRENRKKWRRRGKGRFLREKSKVFLPAKN